MKISKPDNYSIISNSVINDKRLSWEARGVLVYLLSKKNGWEVRQSDLIAQSPAGRVVIERVVKELVELGYMKRTRFKDEKGLYRTFTTVYELPVMPVNGNESHPLSITHSG